MGIVEPEMTALTETEMPDDQLPTSTPSGGTTTNTTVMNEWLLLENVIRTMVENWRYQARVGNVWYTILVLLYASMILIGATGNLLVILVVVRNVAMRTARNVFIVNLAVSDLMLCLITMPLTLVEILYQTWQFGNYPAACPVAALLQGTSIFVSTLSITAIALDRRQLIVCPHKGAWGIKAMLACVPVIWGLALALASPMAIWKKLEYWNDWAAAMNIIGDSSNSTDSGDTDDNSTFVDCPHLLNMSSNGAQRTVSHYAVDENARLNCMLQEIIPRWLHELQSCKEDFPESGRLVYSSITMIIQYLLPTITISIAYYQIYGQLRIRMQQKLSQLAQNTHMASANGGRRNTAVTLGRTNEAGVVASSGPGNVLVERIENDILRMKRTTNLLIWVGVIFCVCWLPLNILNTVMDITENHRIQEDGTKVTSLTHEQFCIIYAICHVTGMLSACANPVIYGYLNENFNREFKEIFEMARPCFHCPTRKLLFRTELQGSCPEIGTKPVTPLQNSKLALQNGGSYEMKTVRTQEEPSPTLHDGRPEGEALLGSTD